MECPRLTTVSAQHAAVRARVPVELRSIQPHLSSWTCQQTSPRPEPGSLDSFVAWGTCRLLEPSRESELTLAVLLPEARSEIRSVKGSTFGPQVLTRQGDRTYMGPLDESGTQVLVLRRHDPLRSSSLPTRWDTTWEADGALDAALVPQIPATADSADIVHSLHRWGRSHRFSDLPIPSL